MSTKDEAEYWRRRCHHLALLPYLLLDPVEEQERRWMLEATNVAAGGSTNRLRDEGKGRDGEG